MLDAQTLKAMQKINKCNLNHQRDGATWNECKRLAYVFNFYESLPQLLSGQKRLTRRNTSVSHFRRFYFFFAFFLPGLAYECKNAQSEFSMEKKYSICNLIQEVVDNCFASLKTQGQFRSHLYYTKCWSHIKWRHSRARMSTIRQIQMQ